MDADRINIQVQHSHSGKTKMNIQDKHTSTTLKQWLSYHLLLEDGCESCDNGTNSTNGTIMVSVAIVLMIAVAIIVMAVKTHQLVGLLLKLEHNWCNKFSTNSLFTSFSTILTGAFQLAPIALGDSLPRLTDILFCWGLIVVSFVAFVLVVSLTYFVILVFVQRC